MKLSTLLAALEAAGMVSGNGDLDVTFAGADGKPVSVELVAILTPRVAGQTHPTVSGLMLAADESALDTTVSQLVLYADRSSRSIIPHLGIDQRSTRQERERIVAREITNGDMQQTLRALGIVN
jgi:hypothetical protein